MKYVRYLSLSVVVAFLAACTQQAPPSASTEAVSFYAVPQDVQANSTELVGWSFSDGAVVEVIGTGLGSEDMASCEVVEATLPISDPGSVQKLYAQVVIKGKSANPNTDPPDIVTVSTGPQTKTWTLDGSDSDTLTQSFVNPQGQPDLTEGGQVYEGSFDAAASITATVEGAVTEGFCQPRAFVVYVFRDSDTALSAGKTPNYYVYWNEDSPSATETISLPSEFPGGDVEVTFAIADLESDSRNVVVSASAGGVSESASFTTPNQRDELLITTLTLQNVLAGTTSVTATVESPDGTGDSVYWNGLNVTITETPPPPPPPPPGDEGCTPGYWKNHTDSWTATGYSPSQTIGSVFSGASAFPSLASQTLLQGLQGGGGPGTLGGAKILLRAAVAALLNASHPDVAYPHTVNSVIDDVNAALASNNRNTMLSLATALDRDNNLGCPLN